MSDERAHRWGGLGGLGLGSPGQIAMSRTAKSHGVGGRTDGGGLGGLGVGLRVTPRGFVGEEP